MGRLVLSRIKKPFVLQVFMERLPSRPIFMISKRPGRDLFDSKNSKYSG